MATPKAKAVPTYNAPAPNKLIPLPTPERNLLEEAINQFILWEIRSRDCIKVKHCYIDVAQDLEAGVLLSQIIYWHLPNKEGEQKPTVQRDGHWWLAKAREDWWDECRLTPKQFDRAIHHLEAKQLICTKVYKWQGQNTKHIRVNWAALLQALSMLDNNAEKIVGFRRREPVMNAGRPRAKTTEQDTSGCPNRQSSRLPNRGSSKLPNSQSLNFLIGNPQIPKQESSELPTSRRGRESSYLLSLL